MLELAKQVRDVHMCDMTHSYVWRDSFVCVTWHIERVAIDELATHVRGIHMCDMTHSFVWRDSIVCVTWNNETDAILE